MSLVDVDVTIEGLQDAQRLNNRAIAALQPTGALGRAVQVMLAEAHRMALIITHVDTGALRASHRMRLQLGQRKSRGEIFIDPSAVNPFGEKPIEYGPMEHARSGSHAFYDRVVAEHGARILRRGRAVLMRGLP